MKMWVDDERPAPDATWVVATTSEEAISRLHAASTPGMGDVFEEVSMDHDLGGDDTGMKVVDWMVSWNYWPKVVTIHTANPPARDRMLAAVNAEAPASTDIYIIYR